MCENENAPHVEFFVSAIFLPRALPMFTCAHVDRRAEKNLIFLSLLSAPCPLSHTFDPQNFLFCAYIGPNMLVGAENSGAFCRQHIFSEVIFMRTF